MAETTGIAWTDSTFNPFIGCTAISPGCDHCYAKTLVERWGGDSASRRRTRGANWKLPRRWDRAAAATGRRQRVFSASLADVFDNQADPAWRDDLWTLIQTTPNLDWLLLTKRPQNIMAMLPEDWGDRGYPNVWLGTTVENTETAAQRLPHLLSIPAPVHFVSCEPLLERVDLRRVALRNGLRLNALTGYYDFPPGTGLRQAAELLAQVPRPFAQRVDWVIIGGESGHGARPMDRAWVADLLHQCHTEGPAPFVKQVGSNPGIGWGAGITGKGDEPEQWPAGCRIQQFPTVRGLA